MPGEPVRAGLIGFGSMGKVILRALRSIPAVEAIAVCDPDRSRWDETGGTARYFGDHRSLLADFQPDLVCIATLPCLHRPMLEAAASAGARWILCEKPIATSVRDARAMIDLCEARGVALGVNHGKRSNPRYAELKRHHLAAIGDVRSITYVCGGGRLGCVGTHIYDLVRYLFDTEIVWVNGAIDSVYVADHKGRPDAYDPGGHSIAMCENGSRILLDVCEDMGISGFLTLNGSLGRIVVDEVNDTWTRYRRREADRERRLGEYDLPLQAEEIRLPFFDLQDLTERMISSVLAGRPDCTGSDGLKSIEPVLSTHLSHQIGRRVELPIANHVEISIDFS